MFHIKNIMSHKFNYKSRIEKKRIFQTSIFEPSELLSIFVIFIKIKKTALNVEVDDI